MKKLITICAAGAMMATNASAQDTLFGWNLFHANDIITYGHANTVLAPNVNPGNNGLGQTWVFTTLAFDYLDTMNVVEMNDVPAQYSNLFPQSNLALYYGTDQTYFDFVHTDGQSLYIDGTASLDPNFGVMAQEFSDPAEYLHWPMMFGVNFQDTAMYNHRYPTTGPSDSAWEISTIAMDVSVDAQGTLITSYGTYDIIRIRRDFDYSNLYATHDPNTGWTSFSPISFNARVYEWWTDSIHIGWMVASMNVNPANNAVYDYMIQTNYVVSVPNYTPVSAFTLFPNPASDRISVSGQINSTWEIVDANGRPVKNGTLRNRTEEIEIGELASGLYVMKITDATGEQGCTRFIRQ